MIIPDFSSLNGPQWAEKHFIHHYPEFRTYLNDTYPEDITFQEKIYWYMNNINEYPICPTCGARLKLINVKEGYQKYCSKKCSNSNPEKKELNKHTMIARYGGFGNASEAIKEKVLKTNRERYGVDSVFQNKEIQKQIKSTIIERYGGFGNASEAIKEKQKNTLLEKYGTDNIMKLNEYKELHKQISLEKTGYVCPLNVPEVMKKARKAKAAKTLQTHSELIKVEDSGIWVCECPHPECNKCNDKYYTVRSTVFLDRKKDHTEPCTHILPEKESNIKGTTIELFIRDILDRLSIRYETNARGIIGRKELDIYIPDKGIAIECNGVFSHSVRYKENLYHVNKYKDCADKNIQLLTIWEDWIKNKHEIVESLIKSKLGIYDNRYGAREFQIKTINKKLACEFLDKNHIQGRTTFEVAYALVKEDRIYSVMTFGKKKILSGNIRNENIYELNRFCTILNTQIIGAASKLINAFIKDYNPKSILSFASNDISNGSLYKTLGFHTDNKISQSYWYIQSGSLRRYHRSTFTKASIVNRGWEDVNDSSWKEIDVVMNNGYYCIYDSGITKYILNI